MEPHRRGSAGHGLPRMGIAIGGGQNPQGAERGQRLLRPGGEGVRIGKGAHIKNCIIMQDTIIGDNADLSHIIIDKDVTVGQGKTIIGCESYPMYIAKRSVI